MSVLKGDISLLALTDVLLTLSKQRASGKLRIQSETQEKSFDILEGCLTGASSNDPREYFGQYLVLFGLLTEDQLQRAFETQQETNVFLGRILVMIGIVPEAQALEILTIKIKETLLEALRWSSGNFEFTPALETDDRSAIDVSIGLSEIHREAISRKGFWEEYKRLFPNPTHVLYVDESRVPPNVASDTLDGKMIGFARRCRSIESISLELHAPEYQIASRLYALHAYGALHARESSVVARPDLHRPAEGQSHSDLALKALSEQRFSEALRHAEKGGRKHPNDESYVRIRATIVSMVREEMDRIPSDAQPTLLRDLTAEERRQLLAKERYLFGRIDGRRSVRAIIQVSPMDDIEAIEILRRFDTMGLINLGD